VNGPPELVVQLWQTLRQCLDEALACCFIKCFRNIWIADGKEFLLLQLDALPRRVAQNHIESTACLYVRKLDWPGSGLVRSTAMRDQKDPSSVYMMVVFESEEKARAQRAEPGRERG
jgi:hypothetical protein